MNNHFVTLLLGINIFMLNVAAALEVNITADIEFVSVMHNSKKVEIKRHQDTEHLIQRNFSKTSRPCPPFCINPMTFKPGIETIGELEVIDYLKKMTEGDTSILVVDSRTPDLVVKGSIPGAVSIPWDVLNGVKSHQPLVQKFLAEQFDIQINKTKLVFTTAKTIILFCNGPWCNQSSINITTLLELGYPSEKLKWYRGGMQAWESFGLTTVTDIPMPWLGL